MIHAAPALLNPVATAIVVALVCFLGYLLGVRLITWLSSRLHSIGFIKNIHLAVFIVVTALLIGFLYEAVADRIGVLTWATVGIFAGEGEVLITNRWRCPLTDVAEGLGSRHGQVTDILLPKSIADNVWTIYTWLFAAGFVLLVIRLLT